MQTLYYRFSTWTRLHKLAVFIGCDFLYWSLLQRDVSLMKAEDLNLYLNLRHMKFHGHEITIPINTSTFTTNGEPILCEHLWVSMIKGPLTHLLWGKHWYT